MATKVKRISEELCKELEKRDIHPNKAIKFYLEDKGYLKSKKYTTVEEVEMIVDQKIEEAKRRY